MKTCILQEIPACEEQETLNNPNLCTFQKLHHQPRDWSSCKISLFKSAAPWQLYLLYPPNANYREEITVGGLTLKTADNATNSLT